MSNTFPNSWLYNIYLDWYGWITNMPPTEQFTIVIKTIISSMLLNYFVYSCLGVNYQSQTHKTINNLLDILVSPHNKDQLTPIQQNIQTQGYILVVMTMVSVLIMLWVL